MQKRKSYWKLGMGAALLAATLLSGALLVPRALGEATLDAKDKKVVARVEEILRERVSSPNKNFKLVIKPTERADQGYFSEILIDGQPVQIKKLRVTAFTLRARNVRISVPALDDEKIRTISSQTTLRAVVTEQDLTDVFSRGKHSKAMGLKAKYLKDPQHGDVLQVKGNWAWTWFSGPVVGVAKLKVSKDNKVYADILSLQLNGREVPAFVKNKFSEKINPLIDYNDVPFQPRFRAVKVEGSRAIIFA